MSGSLPVAARKRLGRLEAVFLVLLLLDIALYFVRSMAVLGALCTVAVLILGAIVLVRLVRRNLRQLLWRLRNRLIVSYLFIAVVPIVLVMLMVGMAGYVLLGQIAIYAVTTELDRRSAGEPEGTPWNGARARTPILPFANCAGATFRLRPTCSIRNFAGFPRSRSNLKPIC